MPNIALKRLMFFNSSEGHQESQEGDKLLFHWAQDLGAAEEEEGEGRGRISETERINDICLCDASVNVGQQLAQRDGGGGDPLPVKGRRKSILTFERTLVVTMEMEPEQSIWMAVHVAAPPTQAATCIPTAAIERVMNNIYDRFCLLNGTFKMIAAAGDDGEKQAIRERMRTVCDKYFSQILPEIHLNSIISNVASLYNAILYIDLNPITLMKINSFINHLVCLNASQIQHTMLIFNDQLLWSSLNLRNTRQLYNYMVSVLIRGALQEELTKEVDEVRKIKEALPLYLEGDDDDSKRHLFYMTVFRSRNNMTLGLILNESNCSELIQKCELMLTSDSRLGVIPLASLAQSVGQKFLKANTSQSHASTSSAIPPSDYIFMDNLDASIAWPVNIDMLNKEHLIAADSGGGGGGGGAADGQSKKMRIIRYLIDLEPALNELEGMTGSQVEEFFGRTLSDSWLTITNSKYRTIYSMHHFRNSSLCEARQSAINMKSQFSKNRL